MSQESGSTASQQLAARLVAIADANERQQFLAQQRDALCLAVVEALKACADAELLRNASRAREIAEISAEVAACEVSGLRFMRDPTRGGLATVCHELQRATGKDVILQQTAIPVRDPVQSVCDILGYDPMYLACEGRVVAVVDPGQADSLLQRWHALPDGKGAACIGHIDTPGTHVILQTELGGQRILEELEDDPLPRIC